MTRLVVHNLSLRRKFNSIKSRTRRVCLFVCLPLGGREWVRNLREGSLETSGSFCAKGTCPPLAKNNLRAPGHCRKESIIPWVLSALCLQKFFLWLSLSHSLSLSSTTFILFFHCFYFAFTFTVTLFFVFLVTHSFTYSCPVICKLLRNFMDTLIEIGYASISSDVFPSVKFVCIHFLLIILKNIFKFCTVYQYRPTLYKKNLMLSLIQEIF